MPKNRINNPICCLNIFPVSTPIKEDLSQYLGHFFYIWLMVQALYNPFKTFEFSDQVCFLTGAKLHAVDEQISVFPRWLMQRYELEDKPFKLLDESITSYKQLKIPCATDVADTGIEPLEESIQLAFMEGYQAVKKMPSITLFQWMAKLVYGVIFNEIRIGIRQQKTAGEQFTISQSLVHKFTNLHLMLQSLIRPVEFEGNLPWTIHVVPVSHSADLFSYRDEVNTLTFCLRMNDFGIIACLQDNGANKIYHQDLLDKIKDAPLHPIQFEELCGRFFYSNYLFNRLPEYTIMPTEHVTYIDAMPLQGISNKPLFDAWQTKTYGQVLANFWKAWNILLFDIIKDPDNPMSFLLDEKGECKPSSTIAIPS